VSMISYTMDNNDIDTARKLIAKANAAWIIAPKENVEPIDLYALIATALGEARQQGRQEAAVNAKPAKKVAE
jgi:hypothetical protein